MLKDSSLFPAFDPGSRGVTSSSDPLPSTLTLAHPQRERTFHFEAVAQGDPCLWARVEARETRAPDRAVVDCVEHYAARFLNSEGKQVGATETISLEVRPEQDVVDLLVWGKRDNDYYVAVTRSVRPAVAALHPDRGNGLEWCLPGHYIRPEEGETSITHAVHQTLAEKVGLPAKGAATILSGACYPSAGDSLEICLPRAVEVDLPRDLHRAAFASDRPFAYREVKFEKIGDVFAKCVRGEYHCPRLATAVMHFARAHAIRLPEVGPLVISEDKNPSADIAVRILSPEQASKILREVPKDSQTVVAVQLQQEAKAPRQPFLSSVAIDFTGVMQNGAKSAAGAAHAVVRQDPDSLVACPYFAHDGKVYIGFGIDPLVARTARNDRPHPVYTDPMIRSAAAFATRAPAGSELEALASAVLLREAGLTSRTAPQTLVSGFPSPGYNPQWVDVCAVEIDPSQAIAAERTCREVFFIEAQQLLDLAEQGLVPDMNLTLAAQAVLHRLGQLHEKPPVNFVSSDERDEFFALLDSGSDFSQWVYADPDRFNADRILSEIAAYRQLRSIVTNEVGGLITALSHPEERIFFSPSVAVLLPHDYSHAGRANFFAAHDWRHWQEGELIPYRLTQDGSLALRDDELEVLPFEDYLSGMMALEDSAGFFSDVELPGKFGHSRSREVFNGMSVAEAFEILDIGDPAHARQVYTSIQSKGIIPKEILQHSRYEDVREVLIDRLLKYHVLFREHIKIMYQNWVDHPEMARLALLFGQRTFSDPKEVAGRSEAARQEVRAYREGFNPIKAHLARIGFQEISVIAFQVGHYLEQLRTKPEAAAQEASRRGVEILRGLKHTQEQLSRVHGAIRNIDPSHDNLQAMRACKLARSGIIHTAQEFVASLLQEGSPLSEAERRDGGGRLLPFFKELSFAVTEGHHAEIARLEAASFARAKLSPRHAIAVQAPTRGIERMVAFQANHILGLAGDTDIKKNEAIFGNCAHEHEHTYRLTLKIVGPIDSEYEMILNARVVRNLVHDKIISPLQALHPGRVPLINDFPGVKGRNPTAECLTEVFFKLLAPEVSKFGPGIRLRALTLSESEKTHSFAEADLSGRDRWMNRLKVSWNSFLAWAFSTKETREARFSGADRKLKA